jgi:flagellar biosynthetic protein FliQ
MAYCDGRTNKAFVESRLFFDFLRSISERLEATVSADIAVQLLANVLWNALLIASPLLLVMLLVGLLVSVIQVVTQVQEMSLTFIPKIISAIIVLVVFGPWMLKRLMTFSIGLISNIPAYF